MQRAAGLVAASARAVLRAPARLRAPAATSRCSSSSSASSSAPLPPRPFTVLGVQQIAVGGTDKARLARLWVDVLGLARVGTYTSARENVDEDILRAGRAGDPAAVEVDIMQPLDAGRAPRVHEPALNHVGLWVDDLRSAVSWMTAAGVRFAPGGIRRGAAGFDVCFIHPKGNDAAPLSGEGVLIELVQAPPEVIAALK
jgi:lactoylglutathione lyase